MVKWIEVIAFLALPSLASCDARQERTVEMDIKMVDGLRLGVPKGRELATAEGQVKLNPQQLMRSGNEITIWTVPPPALPKGAVTAGDDPAPHTLVTIEGGMGGPDYELSIPKRLGDREVTVRARIQSEDGQPQFADAWAVWRSLAEDKSPSPD